MAFFPAPAVTITQKFTPAVSTGPSPLRSVIVGPEYKLHRFDVPKDGTVPIEAYDMLAGNVLDWAADLGRTAGGIVDQAYTKVRIRDAALRYFNNPAGYTVTVPSNHPNRAVFDKVLTAANGGTIDPLFGVRGVKVGDQLTLTNASSATFVSRVVGFIAETDAAVVSPVQNGTGNAIATVASGPTATVVSSPDGNTVTVSGTYSGVQDGVLSESYTIRVTRGSTGGDPRTMTLNLISASGKDDVMGYIPTTTAFNQDIPLGTNGLLFQFAPAATDIDIADEFTVDVTQAFTPPTVTSGGVYTGTKDTIYELQVVIGGDIASATAAARPTVRVVTNNGIDYTAPRQLSQNETVLSLGSFGVTATISGSLVLRSGDVYNVAVTSAQAGDVMTAILDQAAPTTFQAPALVTAQIAIVQTVELPVTLPLLSLTLWEQSATELEVFSNAQMYTSEWYDSTVPLPITSGFVEANWREAVSVHADTVYAVRSVADMDSMFSTQMDSVENPLAFHVKQALLNTGNPDLTIASDIRFLAVAEDTVDAWTAALSTLENRTDIHAINPITNDLAVLDLVAAHIKEMSLPENAAERTGIFSVEVPENREILSGSATLTTGGLLSVVGGGLVDPTATSTGGIRPGDKVFIGFATTVLGGLTHDTYTVDQVLSDGTLQLVEPPLAQFSTPTIVEIWRAQTSQDMVDYAVSQAARWATRRIVATFKYAPTIGGQAMPSTVVSSMIAGLATSAAPAQGLTNAQVSGLDQNTRQSAKFSRAQLDQLANGGVLIVAENVQTAAYFVRQQVTTDVTDINTREMSVTRMVDFVTFQLRQPLMRFIGRTNVSASTIANIRTNIESVISLLRSSSGAFAQIGNVLGPDTQIISIEADPILKDAVNVQIQLDLEYPLNQLNVTLII